MLSVGARAETLAEAIASIPPSPWIEAEKDRHTALLEREGTQVVIPPFQARGDTLDSIGRSMLARMIAARVERWSELAVADPGLIGKALGATARTYADDAIYTLGNRVGAPSVVIGHVSHDRQGQLHVTVEVRTALPGFLSGESATKIFDWTEIRFSDTALPEQVFAPMADEIAAFLTGSAPHEPRLVKSDIDGANVPESFDDLKRLAARSPLHEALYLQFLAALFPHRVHNREREQMFERSLIALELVAPESSGYRLLKARALANLHRRPAAIEALGPAATPAEVALRAYLDADLPTLEAAVDKISDSPLFEIAAELELERIRQNFGRDTRDQYGLTLVERYGAWAPLIYRTYIDGDRWSRFSNAWVMVAMDTFIPGSEVTFEQMLRARAAERRPPPTEADFAKASFQRLSPLIETAYPQWLEHRPSATFPYEGDIRDLALVTLMANAVQLSRTERTVLGRSGRSQALIAEHEPFLAGHPAFEMERAAMLGTLAFEDPAPEREFQNAKIKETLRNAFRWTGEQTEDTIVAATSGLWTVPFRADAKAEDVERLLYLSDFPRRPYPWLIPGVGMGTARMDARACLDYDIDSFVCAKGYLAMLDVPDLDGSQTLTLLAEIEGRFVGHPAKLELMTEALERSGDTGILDSIYRSLIAEGDTEWEPYEKIAKSLFMQGAYADAVQIVLQYPGFSQSGLKDAVTLTSYAYEMGSMFFWVGAYEQARPLYEMAVAYRTGSEGALASESRLAILDGDLARAADISLQRARRYDSIFAYRDYIAFLHVFGQRDAAWDLFDVLVLRSRSPEIWAAALAGHRIEGASEKQIAGWLMAPARRNIKTEETAIHRLHLATHYGLLSGIMDRVPSAEWSETLAAIDPGPSVLVGPGGGAELAGPGFGGAGPGRTVLGPAEPFRGERPFPKEPGEQLELLASIVTAGLRSLYLQRYDDAFTVFDDASYFYDLKEFLPYYAWASAKTGETSRIETYLNHRASVPARQNTLNLHSLDDSLARAYIAGIRGQHGEALARLAEALHNLPTTATRSVFTFYQIVEAAEVLFDDTRHEPYRQLALNLARRHIVIQPHIAWPYAFVAKLTEDKEERIRNLAMALHLDPGSWRASQFSSSERKEAADWRKTSPDDAFPNR